MINQLFSLQQYFNQSTSKDRNYSAKAEDRNYSLSGAVTLGSTAIGGTRGFGTTKGGTFDYLSTAENTVDCYYQKLSDLRYYESHDLTEKIIGLYRDYINQLWREGSDILDIPGEDPALVKALNNELEAMDVLEIITRDLSDIIYYGSVTYEISEVDHSKHKKTEEKDPDRVNISEGDSSVDTNDLEKAKDERNLYRGGATSDSTYSAKFKPFDFGPLRQTSQTNVSGKNFYKEIAEERMYGENYKSKARRLVDSTSPEMQSLLNETDPEFERQEIKNQRLEDLIDSTSPEMNKIVERAKPVRTAVRDLIDNTRPAGMRGSEEYRNPTSVEADADVGDKIAGMRGRVPHKATWKLNKVKFPHHTIIENSKEEGKRYLIKANDSYHLPANKHNIFYYGNDSMRLMEESLTKGKGKLSDSNIFELVGHKPGADKKRDKEYKRLGIDPKDPKKKPTRYELMERELSAAVPLFYFHLPKVRELYLKDLVIAILGIKDVIQPDILAMNFEGGMDIDQAQDMCNNLEDLLNKNSDYGIFNSASLDYNQLVKLLVDTVRILPDIDGKIQSLNPVRTTSLQEKIQQIRMEYQELNRSIIAALGVPIDLFEGNSSKWEVIKRSERLQSKVNYYINTVKLSVRRLAQSIYYKQTGRELKLTDFKITMFNESDLELAAKTNRLQSINELNSTLLQIVASAERDLLESQLVNKRAYYKLLQSSLKEVYPEVDNLLLIENLLGNENDESPELDGEPNF